MFIALRDGSVQPEQVGYVNAHGSSTPLGDHAEALAIQTVFGERAGTVPVSGTKPLYGHPLGASGAIEAAIVCLALANGVLPPSLNRMSAAVDTPEAALALVRAGTAYDAAEVALSNSFGFGGINACLAFRTWDGSGRSSG